MILFSTKPLDFVEQMYLRATHGIEQIVTYNFNSYNSSYPTLFQLSPPSNIYEIGGLAENVSYESLQFDIAYCNYLSSNDAAFVGIMSMIVMPIFDSPNVCIVLLISHSDYRDNYTNCLIKYLQERYGLNSYIIDGPGDLEYVEECAFSVLGLANFQVDRQRFYTLIPPPMIGEP